MGFKIHHEFSCKLDDCKTIREYCLGGRGVVTLLSPKTGVHHTYYFQRPRNRDSFPEDVRFVYAVHDGNKLFYIGMIEMGRFRLTRNSRFTDYNEITKGARYIMKMMNDPKYLTNMELYHEGVCSVCGRPLTSPKSLKTGIGPRCRKYLQELGVTS